MLCNRGKGSVTKAMRWRIAAGLLALASLVAACTREPLVRQQSFVFGTLVEISIWNEDETLAKEATAKVLREFDRLHRDLHAWKPSEITRLNAAFAAGPAKVSVNPEIEAILKDATQLSERSNALFNPAIGRLVQLWGFQGDEFKPVRPAESELSRVVLAHPRMNDLVFEKGAVLSTNPLLQLDLGGYAKGYALDLAARALRREGVKNALINIGGNILALGEHGDRPWRVGIQHPRQPRSIATLDLYDGEAIGTSGDYQRYFELDGKRYCHIIDPRNGRPAQGVQAVTVIARGGPYPGALSDAASKPLFISGRQGWRDAARTMGITSALLVDDAGEMYLTTAMAKRISFDDRSLVAHEVP